MHDANHGYMPGHGAHWHLSTRQLQELAHEIDMNEARLAGLLPQDQEPEENDTP
jgi:hypothetical protein